MKRHFFLASLIHISNAFEIFHPSPIHEEQKSIPKNHKRVIILTMSREIRKNLFENMLILC